jgi:bla regulator protein blaR1
MLEQVILELLAESALRSIMLGGAAWLGLTLMRVRNPHIHMTAWTVVLIVSMAMPLLTPWMKVTIPADQAPRLVKITWTEVPGITPQPAQRSAVAVSQPDVVVPPPTHAGEWWTWATGVYVVVGGAMMLRLLMALMLMWHVARAARPVGDTGADVRVSDIVVVPVTFASTILLPAAASAWPARKLQAVLLHEGAHVAHADFYVLLFASINRAVFWFNPFAWWLFGRLADLAEVVSDDAAIAALGDRTRYADILLDVAINPQHPPAGLAMAHPGTVRRRVQRILAATALPARICWRRRMLTAVALVPMAALSAVTIAQSAAPPQPDLVAPPAPPPAGASLDSGPTPLDRYVGIERADIPHNKCPATEAAPKISWRWCLDKSPN